MKRKYILVLVLVAYLSGCAGNPSRTHRGDLLDDKVTADRVQQALKTAGPDFQSVHAGATNGAVVLTGKVKSPELRTRAVEVARSVRRVTQLEDKVQIGQ